MIGNSGFPKVSCNLPWVFAIIEADGRVRPCYLHRELGNIRQAPFEKIVNSDKMLDFRRNLRRARDSTCVHCIFSSTRMHLKVLYESI